MSTRVGCQSTEITSRGLGSGSPPQRNPRAFFPTSSPMLMRARSAPVSRHYSGVLTATFVHGKSTYVALAVNTPPREPHACALHGIVAETPQTSRTADAAD